MMPPYLFRWAICLLASGLRALYVLMTSVQSTITMARHHHSVIAATWIAVPFILWRCTFMSNSSVVAIMAVLIEGLIY
jgi:hypothetical protein